MIMLIMDKHVEDKMHLYISYSSHTDFFVKVQLWVAGWLACRIFVFIARLDMRDFPQKWLPGLFSRDFWPRIRIACNATPNLE